MTALQCIVAGLVVLVIAVLYNAVADTLSAAEAVGVGAGVAIGGALAVVGLCKLAIK